MSAPAPECPILAGRCVVVTRPLPQAQSFRFKLEAEGASVFLMPLIRFESVKAALPNDLSTIDWLVLTSSNTVDFFYELLCQQGRNYRDFAHCHVAAIGEATARALEAHGITAGIVPAQHHSDALVEAIVQAEATPVGKVVLLPQSSRARPVIADGLAARGMLVHTVSCYDTRNVVPEEKEISALVACKPDVVTFFSPSAVETFVEAGLHTVLEDLKPELIYASIGPVTTEALEQARLTPVIEASRQNEDNLVQALCTYCKQNSKPRI